MNIIDASYANQINSRYSCFWSRNELSSYFVVSWFADTLDVHRRGNGVTRGENARNIFFISLFRYRCDDLDRWRRLDARSCLPVAVSSNTIEMYGEGTRRKFASSRWIGNDRNLLSFNIVKSRYAWKVMTQQGRRRLKLWEPNARVWYAPRVEEQGLFPLANFSLLLIRLPADFPNGHEVCLCTEHATSKARGTDWKMNEFTKRGVAVL